MGVKWYHKLKKGTQRVNGENIMMNVKVKIYNGVKYNMESEKVAEVEYKHIKGFEVVTGERATEIGVNYNVKRFFKIKRNTERKRIYDSRNIQAIRCSN